MSDFGYGNARYQHPECHWLDLPEFGDPDAEEDEEEKPLERKPLATFTDRQILLVLIDGKIKEYPVGGDEKKTGDHFSWIGYTYGTVIGYILNRDPKFEPSIYGWGYPR